MKPRQLLLIGLALGLVAGFSVQETQAVNDLKKAEREATIKSSVDVALRFLWSKQGTDGSWNGDSGLTALALRSFINSPRRYTPQDGPFITRAIDFLSASVTAGQMKPRSLSPLGAGLCELDGTVDPGLHLSVRQRLEECLKGDAREQIDLRTLGFLLVGATCPRSPMGPSQSATLRPIDAAEPSLERLPKEYSRIQSLVELAGHRLAAEPISARKERMIDNLIDQTEQLNQLNSPVAFHQLFFLASLMPFLESPSLEEPRRDRLADHLIQVTIRQRSSEGWWVNPSGTWGEQDAVTCTILAVLSLEQLASWK